MIEYRSIGKTFADGTEAVGDFSLQLPSRTTTVFVGSSGCGKTTLLRMVNRMVDPTHGQVLIDDVDDAVREIGWAKEAGMRQVLLPSDHHLKLHQLYYASLDPIWSVCEDLDMPIGRHGSVVGSDAEVESIDAAHAIGVLETTYFGQRSLAQLILSGVFERHPRLKFVFTELGAGAWSGVSIQRMPNLKSCESRFWKV